jgi:hypothetical protein
VLSDVFFRIGGAGTGKATQSLVINSSNVIGDDMWLWRADHGDGVGWTTNTAANGLVVNGANVTMYGLFVEHYQQYQTIWNGNGGRTYFYQNEMPYDPPNQASWMNGGTRGYAAYKVADSVTSHEAWGLGSYCYFSSDPSVVAEHAFEVPNTAGVKFHDMITVSLGGTGTINHIIDSSGGPSNSSSNVATLNNSPKARSTPTRGRVPRPPPPGGERRLMRALHRSPRIGPGHAHRRRASRAQGLFGRGEGAAQQYAADKTHAGRVGRCQREGSDDRHQPAQQRFGSAG